MSASSFKIALFAGLIASAVIDCTVVPHALAQGQSRPPQSMLQFQQIDLTRGQVKGFIDSFPEFRKMEEKYDTGKSDAGNPLDGAAALYRHKAAQAEMQRILEAHGFSDMSQWMKVAQTVALTYSFLKSGRMPSDLSAEAKTAIAKIDSNPKLSSEQKAQFKAMMNQQMGMISRLQPREANVVIVKDMMPQLGVVMDSE